MLTEEETKLVNKTSRGKGAVGRNALVPKVVLKLAKDTGNMAKQEVIDFGAGKEAIHTKWLRKKGLNVEAHEIGDNSNYRIHNVCATLHPYDIVMASNILNVQPTYHALKETLMELRCLTRPYGMLVCNYPAVPRKLPLNTEEMELILELIFHEVKPYITEDIPKCAHIYICKGG